VSLSSTFPIRGAHWDKNIGIRLNHIRDPGYGLNLILLHQQFSIV